MHRNSIELSPKSLPRQLRQNSNEGVYTPYSETSPSISRFHTESSTASPNHSSLPSYTTDLYSLNSPSSQSSNHTSPSQSLNALLEINMLDEPRIDYSGRQSLLQMSSEDYKQRENILSRIWNPCSGGCSIGEQIDGFEFPISYRDLVYRWIALDRPDLEFLRVPLDVQMMPTQQQFNFSILPEKNPSFATSDLQHICEAQELAIIESLSAYFNNGSQIKVNSFLHFASHLDVYSAVNAEIICLEDKIPKNSKNIARLYEEIWWNTLQAFDFDRSICTTRTSHSCFRYLLWGEVNNWPLEDIINKFQIYKNRSSIIKPILIKQFKQDISGLVKSSSASCLSTRSLDDGGPKVSSPSFSTPSFSTHTSTLDLIEFMSGVEDNNFSIPLSSVTSYSQSDRNNLGNNSTPSVKSISTPGSSPVQHNLIQQTSTSTYHESDSPSIQSFASSSQGNIPWESTIGVTQPDSYKQSRKLDLSSIPSFDLLQNLQDSSTNTSSLTSSFLGIRFD